MARIRHIAIYTEHPNDTAAFYCKAFLYRPSDLQLLAPVVLHVTYVTSVQPKASNKRFSSLSLGTMPRARSPTNEIRPAILLGSKQSSQSTVSLWFVRGSQHAPGQNHI